MVTRERPASSVSASKPKRPPIKIPKSNAAAGDLLYKIQQERYKAQKVVDKLQAQESFLKEHFIKTLKKGAATGIRGKEALIYVENEEVYEVQDWNKLQTYIKRNNRFDIFQRRITKQAVKDLFEAGRKVSGIVRKKIPVVRINKVKKGG